MTLGTVAAEVIGWPTIFMAGSALANASVVEDGAFPGYARIFVTGSAISGVMADRAAVLMACAALGDAGMVNFCAFPANTRIFMTQRAIAAKVIGRA